MTRRIEAGPVLVGLGALVVLVSVFLDWYQPNVTAWEAFEALDLRGVRFLDSTGLRLVLELDGAAREDSHELCVIRGSDVVHRIFEVTQVAERLNFVDP